MLEHFTVVANHLSDVDRIVPTVFRAIIIDFTDKSLTVRRLLQPGALSKIFTRSGINHGVNGDFTELKDGTSFKNISKTFELHISKASEPDCISSRAENFNALTVRSSAFSNTWYFQGAESVQTHAFCDAVLWFDQGISTGDHNLAVSIKTERSKPFAIYTNKGFLGVIPDTPQETLFIFENLHLIFSFETEFTKTAPASESKASFLAQADIN